MVECRATYRSQFARVFAHAHTDPTDRQTDRQAHVARWRIFIWISVKGEIVRRRSDTNESSKKEEANMILYAHGTCRNGLKESAVCNVHTHIHQHQQLLRQTAVAATSKLITQVHNNRKYTYSPCVRCAVCVCVCVLLGWP